MSNFGKRKLSFWMALVALVLLALSVVGASGTAKAASSTWEATYWNNRSLSGNPSLQRQEADLNYDWGDGGPGPEVNRDNFSARWKRTIGFSSGTYRFTATTDDGMRVWVDDALLIDSWQENQVRTVSADTSLAAGDHRITIEYYEAAGMAVAKLSWTAITPPPGTFYNWRGEYYNNMNLIGAPVVVRDDANIDFDWAGSPAANVGADNFSVRWTRNWSFSPGRYRFMVTADDGARLWVNNVLLIDRWFDQQATPFVADIDLPGGSIPIKMEYYENVGGAVARLSWGQLSSGGNPTINNWRGEYFNNAFLNGTPSLVRDDGQIVFNWGLGSPAANIPADNFSVRWTRSLAFAPGRYRFTAASDDGVRLWVNNQMVINNWTDHELQSVSGEIDLGGGAVPLKLEYYDHVGKAEVRLDWVQISSSNPTIYNWRGEYFNNAYLSGAPSVVRDDGQIAFNWGYGSPDAFLPADNFSVRWTRNLSFTPGRYRFTATTDDGVRLWVNNQLIINNWSDHARQAVSGEIDLAGGAVPLRMEYYDRSGLAEARLDWAYVGQAPNTGGAPMASVASSSLNVRQGPGTSYAVITRLSRGTLVQLAGYRNADATWVGVVLPDGRQGWSYAGLLQSSFPFSSLVVRQDLPPSTNTGGATGTVTAYNLNVRQGPGVGYSVITVISRNTVVQLIGRNAAASWVKVNLPSGVQGWVNVSYLRVTTSVRALPISG